MSLLHFPRSKYPCPDFFLPGLFLPGLFCDPPSCARLPPGLNFQKWARRYRFCQQSQAYLRKIERLWQARIRMLRRSTHTHNAKNKQARGLLHYKFFRIWAAVQGRSLMSLITPRASLASLAACTLRAPQGNGSLESVLALLIKTSKAFQI